MNSIYNDQFQQWLLITPSVQLYSYIDDKDSNNKGKISHSSLKTRCLAAKIKSKNYIQGYENFHASTMKEKRQHSYLLQKLSGKEHGQETEQPLPLFLPHRFPTRSRGKTVHHMPKDLRLAKRKSQLVQQVSILFFFMYNLLNSEYILIYIKKGTRHISFLSLEKESR